MIKKEDFNISKYDAFYTTKFKMIACVIYAKPIQKDIKPLDYIRTSKALLEELTNKFGQPIIEIQNDGFKRQIWFVNELKGGEDG